MHGEQGILRWAKEWKADAIIGQWNNDTIDLQKELNIPVVLQNYHHRSVTYSNLTGDYKGTGRMAAQFFAKRMFRNFAYLGVKGVTGPATVLVFFDKLAKLRFIFSTEQIIERRLI
jgi:LacI family transcriptional regulator